MSTFVYPPQQATISGVATEATLLLVEQNTADTVTELQTLNSDVAKEAKQDTQIVHEAAIEVAVESIDAKVATETTLASVSSSVSSINTKTPALGQAVMASSSPVVIASNQTAIPSSQSGTWNVNNITGTVTLPTGASTSALQTTGNNTLSSIETNTAAIENGVAILGQSYPFYQIDGTPLLNTSTTNIPGSASSVLVVVASTPADTWEVQTVEDIGEYIGLYVDGLLHCVLPLGGGSIRVQFPTGTAVGLRAMEAAAISVGKIAINFLAY